MKLLKENVSNTKGIKLNMLTKIPFKPYEHQKTIADLHFEGRKHGCLVIHRGGGKTYLCVNLLIRNALTNNKTSYIYACPTYSQAKRVAWQYFKTFSHPVTGTKYNESELTIKYPNGSNIMLVGTDNYDYLRGIHINGAIIDEYGMSDPEAYNSVIGPALFVKNGFVIFAGTPAGRNHFYETYIKYLQAMEDNNDFFAVNLDCNSTNLFTVEQLNNKRVEIGNDAFSVEYMNSFDTPIPGSYYGEYIEKARGENRILRLLVDPNLEVSTAWDIGYDDQTSIVFFQVLRNGNINIIDFYENHHKGLDHYISIINKKDYWYGKHYTPHDSKKHEWTSGETILNTAKNKGITFTPVPMYSRADGIHMVRSILPLCFFNEDTCGYLLECLTNYRNEPLLREKAYSVNPKHNWASHAADAFRYMAVAIRDFDHSAMNGRRKKPKQYENRVVF